MAEFVGEILGRLILFLVLFPTCLAMATPFVLLAAPFHQGGVRGGYAAVIRALSFGANFL